jgi:membrane-associated protein
VRTAFLGIFGINIEDLLDSLSPYGEVVLWFIIFAETGLLIGFFLPGDSLLFTAGILASQGKLDIALVVVGCFVAAVIGDQVGYTIGQRLGPRLFRKEDSRIFKQEYVDRTRAFFDKHGPKTIVIARFVPIVRTFAPTLAGVGEMPRSTFFKYNIVGAFIWAVGVTMLGYALGDVIGDSIDSYLLPLVAVIILISLIPPFLEWRKAKRHPHAPVTEAEALAEAEELEGVVHTVAPRTNGFAIAALVLGLVGGWLLALIFGYIGKSQIDASRGGESGRGLAIAGIVLGWIGLAVMIAAIAAIVVVANSA